MRKLVALGCLLLVGAAPPPSVDAKLRSIIAPVSAAQLRHTIEALEWYERVKARLASITKK